MRNSAKTVLCILCLTYSECFFQIQAGLQWERVGKCVNVKNLNNLIPVTMTHTHTILQTCTNTKITTLPCQQEADDGRRTKLQWWCHQVCVLQLAFRWSGQSQLDEDPPKWTELAADKASSWSVKVTKERQISGLLCGAFTGNYLSENRFSWPWQELGAQRSFWQLTISIYSFLLTWLSFHQISKQDHHCNSWDRCSSATWEIQKKTWAKSHWLT